MAVLSEDQEAKRASIQKTAAIWGVIVGVLAGLVALWALGGQGDAVRYGGAAAAALILGALVFRASFNAGARSAKCENCGAAFSRSRTDRAEALVSSEPKEEREAQEDGSVEVTRWTEETYDVTDTYTCAKCGHQTTETYKRTRRKDETTVTEPAPEPQPENAASDGAENATENARPGNAQTLNTQNRRR